jgi:hypothetical protein
MSEAKSFFEQNMAMWESMASNYTDTMFKAVEKALEQSSALQKQINDAVAAATKAQFDTTLSAIKAVERQVEALAEQVGKYVEESE